MLSLILDWQKKEFKFKGEVITIELRPLKRKAMIELLPYMTGGSITAKTALEMQGIAAKIFPDHIRNIQGLEGVTIEGRPVTIEDLSEEMTFFNLTTDIIKALAEVSSLDKVSEGNLNGASGSDTTADAQSN
jgi:hypothetical protein